MISLLKLVITLLIIRRDSIIFGRQMVGDDILKQEAFQLLLATPPPQIAPVLLSDLEKVVRTMDRGYYALP